MNKFIDNGIITKKKINIQFIGVPEERRKGQSRKRIQKRLKISKCGKIYKLRDSKSWVNLKQDKSKEIHAKTHHSQTLKK